MFKYDLHIHSSYSDGTCAPLEILELAKENNLSGLSITDHDSIDAYTDDFFIKAKELNLEIITGIEISSAYLGVNVHILAYGFDLNFSDSFKDFNCFHLPFPV